LYLQFSEAARREITVSVETVVDQLLDEHGGDSANDTTRVTRAPCTLPRFGADGS